MISSLRVSALQLPLNYFPNVRSKEYAAEILATLGYVSLIVWSLYTLDASGMPDWLIIIGGIILCLGLALFVHSVFDPELTPKQQERPSWHGLESQTPIPNPISDLYCGYEIITEGMYRNRRVCLAKAFYGVGQIQSTVIIMNLKLPSEIECTVRGLMANKSTDPSAESQQLLERIVNGQIRQAARFSIRCVPQNLIDSVTKRNSFWIRLEKLTMGSTIHVSNGLLQFEQMIPAHETKSMRLILDCISDLADCLDDYYITAFESK